MKLQYGDYSPRMPPMKYMGEIMERNNLIKKGVVVAVILLFVSVSVIPSTGNRVSFDDITPPVTTCTLNPPEPNGNNSWYVSDVEVTLNATDDMSGVNRTEYRIMGGTIYTYTEPFNVTDEGALTVEYRSIDYAGNVEDWKSVEFKIDQTPPTIDLTWESYEEDVILFTAWCDDTTSGMERVEFYLNDVLLFTDTSMPYEFIVEWPLVPPDKYSVVGFICNRRFKEQNVTFFALLVFIRENLPDFSFYATAYDFAGNSETDWLLFPGSSVSGIRIHMFKRFTFPNDYTGKIGLFFINAEFKVGPL